VSLRFWLLATVFHAALLGVCAVRGHAWLRRDPASLGARGFWGALAVDTFWFGATAFVAAVALAGPTRDPGFTVIRFSAQALFAEAPLFLVFLAVVHWRRGRSRRAVLLALPALALLAVYVDAYHVEPYWLQIGEHDVDLTDDRRSPETGTIRLLHISDIQTHRVRDYEERVVRAAAALEPDLVVLTGDYVDDRLRPGRDRTERELTTLLGRAGPRPPLGTWAVGGDVDGTAIAERLRESGVRWLADQAVAISLPCGPSLTLVGLAPGTSRDRGHATLRRLLANTPPGSPRVVLGHSPDFVLGLEDGPRVDLALAGHTHGGQVVVPFFGPLLTLSRVPRHVAAGGLHALGSTRIHVSRGVGLERGSAPQIRFFCPPEICMLTLSYSR
jgi:predicted MPP superfamily phosphohydrolase